MHIRAYCLVETAPARKGALERAPLCPNCGLTLDSYRCRKVVALATNLW